MKQEKIRCTKKKMEDVEATKMVNTILFKRIITKNIVKLAPFFLMAVPMS